MGYVKLDMSQLESIKSRLGRKLELGKTCLSSINSLANNINKYYNPDYLAENQAAIECEYLTPEYNKKKQVYYNKLVNFNSAVDDLRNSSSSYADSYGSMADDVISAIDGVIEAINEFEEAEIDNLGDLDKDAVRNTADYGDYDEGTAYDRTDRDLEENPSGNDGNDPGVHGTDSSDWDTYTPDTGTDEGENPTGEEQTDTDPGEDTNPDEGENPTGEEQTDTNPGEDATPGDGETSTGSEQTDNKPEEDTSSEDGEKNTGSEQTDKNIDEDKEQGGGDGVDGQDNSGARLVETSGNLVDQLVGEDGLNALEIDDVAAWGAAGMAGLMLGMTNLGTDENGEGFLSNLATGLDDDRTLADSGIDVFEHPDYTDQNDTALLSNGGWSSYDDAVAAGFGDSIMSEAEFLEAKAAGDPSVSQYSSYQEYLDAMYNSYLGGVDGLNSDGNIGAFNLQSANELDGTGNGTSVVGGFAALGGAAAVGGLAAGAVIGADEANGGLISSDMTMNSDGTLSDGKQSINDFLFGALDDPDEEEKKKQTLRERIAMIAAAATGTSSLATFGLANAGVIGPTWFTVSVLLLAVALLYFEMVVDKKNKRREELESVKQMTARRGFFNQNNVQETTTNKQVDWILFGMVLLSTSAFILKTYDVISWLLFLILLILFILIIVAYVILKKKLGENNNGVPY